MSTITPLHAAHIAAQNADLLMPDDDIKGGRKGGKKSRVKGQLDAKGYGKSQDQAMKGQQQQKAMAGALNHALNQNIDDLSDQLSDLNNNRRDLQKKYNNFAGLTEKQRQKSIDKTGNKLVHDTEDFNNDCDDFFGALKKDYGDLGGGSLDGAQAIAEINDLMFKLAKMFQALRNIVQDAKTLFDKLSWDVQISGVKMKLDAIHQTLNAAQISGWCSISGGILGSVASFTGVVTGGMGKVGIGESLSIFGQMSSKIVEGAGGLSSAQATYGADVTRTIAGLAEQIGQQFSKDVNDAYARASKTSSDMISLLTELVNLHRALESALGK